MGLQAGGVPCPFQSSLCEILKVEKVRQQPTKPSYSAELAATGANSQAFLEKVMVTSALS